MRGHGATKECRGIIKSFEELLLVRIRLAMGSFLCVHALLDARSPVLLFGLLLRQPPRKELPRLRKVMVCVPLTTDPYLFCFQLSCLKRPHQVPTLYGVLEGHLQLTHSFILHRGNGHRNSPK